MSTAQTCSRLAIACRAGSRVRLLFAALALALSGTNAVAAGLNAGDLVIGNNGSTTTISVVNPQTRIKTVVCNCTIFNTIKSVTVKGTERIYAIGQLASSFGYKQGVVSIDPVTGTQTVVSSGGSFANLHGLTGIAMEADGNILVSQANVSPQTGMVIRVNAATGQQTILSSGGRMVQAWSLAVGPTGQIFVVASINGFPRGALPSNVTGASGVMRVDPASGQQTVVAYGDDWDLGIASKKMIDASDVAIDENGQIYVLDKRYRGATLEDETRVIKVDPATGAQTMLNNSFRGVDRTMTDFDFRGIAFLNGEVYAVDYRLSAGQPGISKVSASGGTRTSVTSEGFFHPSGLAAAKGASTPSPAPTPSTGPDCFFNWAERTYPQYFAPAGTPSTASGPYYYRYYAGLGNYLATSTTDNHVYVLGPSFGNTARDLGPLAGFLNTAGCSP